VEGEENQRERGREKISLDHLGSPFFLVSKWYRTRARAGVVREG
jgi:hypothetical protein